MEAHHRPEIEPDRVALGDRDLSREEGVQLDDRRRLHPHGGDIHPPERAAVGLLPKLSGSPSRAACPPSWASAARRPRVSSPAAVSPAPPRRRRASRRDRLPRRIASKTSVIVQCPLVESIIGAHFGSFRHVGRIAFAGATTNHAQYPRPPCTGVRASNPEGG